MRTYPHMAAGRSVSRRQERDQCWMACVQPALPSCRRAAFEPRAITRQHAVLSFAMCFLRSYDGYAVSVVSLSVATAVNNDNNNNRRRLGLLLGVPGVFSLCTAVVVGLVPYVEHSLMCDVRGIKP